jgi:hypothetical protein
MDRSIGHFVAAAIAVVAVFAVFAAAVVCVGQATHLPLLTEDLTWLTFDAA